jgi:acetate kinase
VRVLVVNAGSSSLKLRLVDAEDRVVAATDLPASGGDFDSDAARRALGELSGVDVVGHRVVHGGERFISATRITPEVRAALAELTVLAPLHQPKALRGIDLVASLLPEVPAYACFDTAFHRTLSEAARTYALPAEWRAHGLRRFGFHGLSHAWVTRRVAELCGRATPRRLVSCHLGAGASLAAVLDGRCADTTMGFTPLEGLVMATRSGTVDPGLVLWLQTNLGLATEEVLATLESGSGLLGLCGTADMREVLARAPDDGGARLAFDVYIHRLSGAVAAMAASLGGLDVLAFTGGVGERSAPVRAAATARLGFLGVAIEPTRNQAADADAEIGAGGAAVRTFVVTAHEELQIAGEIRSLLGAH